jgi:hypothetical protein
MWLDLALVAGGAFLAAVVIGSAGFAFAMVVTGIWIYVMPPQAIVLLAATCATLMHVVNVWQYRRDVDLRLLWPFLAGGALGVPLGVMALTRVDTVQFRHLFGAFMIAYSACMLARPRLPVVRITGLASRFADGAIGWLGGVLGGLAMLHGPPPTIWCQLRGWDKKRARLVYQPYIGFTAILVMLMVGLSIDVDRARLGGYLLACVPAMAVGLWIGLRVFEWISEERFRRLILWMILISGVSLQF